MSSSRPVLAIAVGMLLALGSACSVAYLTSGGPLGAEPDDAGLKTDDASLRPDAVVKADGGARSEDADLGEHDARGVTADGADAACVAGDAAVVPPMTAVTIENLMNNRYLDVDNSSTSDGATIWTWSITGGTNQQWTFMAVGDSDTYYEIVNQNSGDCVDVIGGSTAKGTRIQQYMCYASPGSDGGFNNGNQLFKLVPFNGHIQLIEQQTGMCLASEAQMDGASVYIWPCSCDPSDLSDQWAIGD